MKRKIKHLNIIHKKEGIQTEKERNTRLNYVFKNRY